MRYDPDVMDPLVERARSGDRGALEALLSSLAPSIHRFARGLCKGATDADDVLQDTLIAVAGHLGEFEGRSSLSSWVFALTRSACSHRRRGLKNRPPEPDDALSEAPDAAPDPESIASRNELGRALTRALNGLSDDYREVILLRDVEGLSAPEAADALSISIDALKSRLHRARGALRDALRPILEPALPSPDDCPDVASAWSRKLEGDLSQQDCAEMERHVASCPTCGAACDALKQALAACRQSANVPVSRALRERIQAALSATSILRHT